MNIIDHDFLMPGHVFARPDGSTSRLLFITNTSLGKKASAKFPPQVVYVDESNNVFSRDIPGFLESREFVNVDPELEAKLNALLKSGSEHPEDELDLESDDDLVVSGIDELDDMLDVMAGGDTETEPSEDEEDGALETAEVPAAVSYVAVNEGLPQILTAEQLRGATVSYEQSTVSGNIQHTLCIRAGDGVTKATLEQSFNPLYQDSSTMYAPQIMLEGQSYTFDWDELIGIYPAVFYDSQIYKVILQSNPQPDGIVAPALSEDEALAALATPPAVIEHPAEIDPTDPRDTAVAAEVVGIGGATPAHAVPTAVAAPAAA